MGTRGQEGLADLLAALQAAFWRALARHPACDAIDAKVRELLVEDLLEAVREAVEARGEGV